MAKNGGEPPPVHSQDAILESISDGVFTVDRDWKVGLFNRAAESITGLARGEALGMPCSEVFKSSMCERRCPVAQTLKSGKPVVNRSGFIIDIRGRRIPVSVSCSVIRNNDGEVVGAVETFRDLSEIESLRMELSGKKKVLGMVSHSIAMQPIFDLLPAVSVSSSMVLLRGETGTGKELLARAIHDGGPRADHPFVAVNCSALPDNLLESELFGHCKGAFTGAERNREGRFASAGRGTLFLDEIGDISPALQVKLLRVLQEQEFEPLGSDRPVPCRARVILATHRDLEGLVRDGEFRQDLFYRINVVELNLPPLRDRPEDLPLLCEHFLERFNARQSRRILGIEPPAMDLLYEHNWPGNIRELENVIERAFVLSPGEYIGIPQLPPHLRGDPKFDNNSRNSTESAKLLGALERNQGSMTLTARELGIHRSTLFRRLRKLGVQGN